MQCSEFTGDYPKSTLHQPEFGDMVNDTFEKDIKTVQIKSFDGTAPDSSSFDYDLKIPVKFEMTQERDPLRWWNQNWIFLHAMIKTKEGTDRSFYIMRLFWTRQMKECRFRPAIQAWNSFFEDLTNDLEGLKIRCKLFMDH